MIRSRSQAGPAENRPALSAAQWSIYENGWDRTARFRVAVCGRRFGKALALGTWLPSPDGWTTMGRVGVGTRLFDEAGRICKITYATETMFGRPCNQVMFDDGTLVIADDDHLWPVSYECNGRTVTLTSAKIRLCLENRQAVFVAAGGGLLPGSQHRRIALRHLCMTVGRQDASGRWHIPGDPALLETVQNLCIWLGLVPRRCRGPGGDTVHWSVRRQDQWRRIVSVVRIASVAVRCVQVDSRSRLFLCSRSLVPTHNTFLMAEELRRAARLAVQNEVGAENEIWYGAPNFLQAKRVMWSRIKRSIPRTWVDGKPNETTCSLRLRSGHVIRLVGLDASDSLRGSGLWFFGGDEWADCRPTAWKEVIRPMLSTARGHALFIGTPKGFDHFRDAYLLGQPGGDPTYRSFLFTTEDGGQVSPEELQSARKELDPRTYRQEYCASFETYSGRVVYAFSRAENVRPCAFDRRLDVHIGIDFNVNPMSATIWQEVTGRLQQIDEIVLPTSNTDEMADEIERRFGRDGFEPGRLQVEHVTVYPDPAGAQRRSSAGGRTDIGILRQKGFKVVALKAHPPVRDRMNIMNREFRNADGTALAIVDPRCVRSIEAYERLVFRDGTSEPDKTQGFDHLVDATGYYMFGRRLGSGCNQVSTFMER